MNLAEMRDEVRTNINRQKETLPDSQVTRFLNWAQRQMAWAHTFDSMKVRMQGTTVDGQLAYNFPERTKEVYSLLIIDGTSGDMLARESPRDFDQAYPNPEEDSEGEPDTYVHFGNYFELYPIPDDAYTMEIRCSLIPAEMTDDSHELTLTEAEPIVVAAATGYAAQRVLEVEVAGWWVQRASNLFMQFVESEGAEPDKEDTLKPFGGGVGSSGLDAHNPFTGR